MSPCYNVYVSQFSNQLLVIVLLYLLLFQKLSQGLELLIWILLWKFVAFIVVYQYRVLVHVVGSEIILVKVLRPNHMYRLKRVHKFHVLLYYIPHKFKFHIGKAGAGYR